MIDRPIFFIGMPRSGTTVVFEAFAARRDVAWLSQYLARSPRATALAALSRLADLTPAMRRSVGRSDRTRPLLEKLRVGPTEAYAFWERCCGEKFRYEYLLGVEASQRERSCVQQSIAKIMRYQGKQRFVAKITGPGRIGYLSSIFPDACFVHLLRDGRAVVHSLMRVPFWRERQRMDEPAWRGGLLEADIADWERYGRSPLALAAVQWRRVVESIRQEAARVTPDRYAEIRYERFVSDPSQTLRGATSFCGLPYCPRTEAYLDRRVELRDMNYRWREHFDAAEITMLNDILGGTLMRLGYQDPPARRQTDQAVEQPFRDS